VLPPPPLILIATVTLSRFKMPGACRSPRFFSIRLPLPTLSFLFLNSRENSWRPVRKSVVATLNQTHSFHPSLSSSPTPISPLFFYFSFFFRPGITRPLSNFFKCPHLRHSSLSKAFFCVHLSCLRYNSSAKYCKDFLIFCRTPPRFEFLFSFVY